MFQRNRRANTHAKTGADIGGRLRGISGGPRLPPAQGRERPESDAGGVPPPSQTGLGGAVSDPALRSISVPVPSIHLALRPAIYFADRRTPHRPPMGPVGDRFGLCRNRRGRAALARAAGRGPAPGDSGALAYL